MAKQQKSNLVIWSHWLGPPCRRSKMVLYLHHLSGKTEIRQFPLKKTLSETLWPDLAKFRHFGKTYSDFGKILMVYLVFGKILTLLCQEFYVIGRIFIAVNGQILNSYQAIWSLWSEFWIVDFKGLLPTYLGEVKPSWTYYTYVRTYLRTYLPTYVRTYLPRWGEAVLNVLYHLKKRPVVDVIKLFLEEIYISPKIRNWIKFVLMSEPAQKIFLSKTIL